eukprot:CAMPEP_0180166822 /NCGR_PEP_ID=MMETSP0986-20121125/31796_1 /TAXON_ID=697907 /ORGANISM="non described non described, Strain CCMP2293" /LENGTH=44 /DNA_ID= /DNA_START= /DNA_END= /DNA_ORIENTATION=
MIYDLGEKVVAKTATSQGSSGTSPITSTELVAGWARACAGAREP